jgi:phage gpG-like protein
MATGLNIKVEITGDRTMFERASKALRNTRPLMQRVASHALSRAVRRLPEVLKPEGGIRTGRLGASLRPGGAGNIFEVDDLRAVVGTNLPYAAQVQFGGPIVPKPPRKALAIPLDERLARQGIGPREFDPSGELLRFVPVRSSPNVVGLLVLDEEIDFGGSLKFGGDSSAKGRSDALYLLATSVVQEPRPYLYFSDDDLRVIRDELVPQWMNGK